MLVIAVDGLRASALGAYGNAWQPTPACDELSSRSVVCEWMYAAGPELADFYAAAWRELPAASRNLLTDDAQIAILGETAGFDEVRLLETTEPDTDLSPAADVAETASAQLFAAAIEQLPALASADRPALLWLHARGFHGPWDAPHALRETLVDADDPPAPTFVDPPRRVETVDHDELFSYRVAYAAQVAVLDECVGALLAAADELGVADRLAVILVGCRGFALGEHGAVGTDARALYGEFIHIPCCIHTPALPPAPPRRTAILRPDCLPGVLLACLAGDKTLFAESAPAATAVVAAPDGEAALRTSEWLLHRYVPDRTPAKDGADPAAAVELFVKPDDRWELNDVASRCPEVVEELLRLMTG